MREMGEARAVDRLIEVIPAAIVFIVAVIMAIGAAFLGYPVWAILLIAIFGAAGAIVAIRVLGW
jgi:membrane protein YdbS with pleckstrin-like domain